jgi:hypothetical protein
MSEATIKAKSKVVKGEIISIFQSGLSKPELVEVNKERRTIRGHEHVVKVSSSVHFSPWSTQVWHLFRARAQAN